jgi:hypothetical protein
MPQLPGNFGSIPSSVVLSGAGSGTVTFQPNGHNARITTLFVKVSTSVAQAKCSIYKGQISDSNIVGLTVSGSTGAPAFGNIDLVDGETLYVVWTGGDAGATATATFTGHTIPFDQVGGSELRWSDPVAGNDGSLVFPAIKSPNFVSGSAGWQIARDGTAEFNNVVVRGFFEAISASGANVLITADASSASVEWQPPNFAGHTLGPGSIQTTSGATQTLMLITGPSESSPVNVTGGEIVLGADSSLPGKIIQLVADRTTIFGAVFNDYGVDQGKGFCTGNGSNSPSGAIGATETVIINIPATGTFTFKANRAYRVETSGTYTVSVVGNRPSFRIRKDDTSSPPTGTQLIFGANDANTSQAHSIMCNGVFRVGAADVTTSLVFTALGSAGFNVSVSGSPVLTIDIYDIGANADHIFAPVLS